MAAPSQRALLRHFLRAEIDARYLGSLLGAAWALINPLILLALYAFVFGQILKVRIPEAGEAGFVVYLALAFWPWVAFSEALQRACGAIRENAALISKVAVPRHLLVTARVLAVFGLHGIGYLLVLITLTLFGAPIHWPGLPAAVLAFFLLMLFALGLGLLIAALEVFVRDLQQALGQFLMLWFFASPIIYSLGLIPERYHNLYYLNPFAHFADAFRVSLLPSADHVGAGFTVALWLSPLIALALGALVFRRLQRHFEDYL